MRLLTMALRSIRRAPGVTSLVVATLGIGVALVTSMFTLLNGYMFAELPYDEANRIVAVGVENPREGSHQLSRASPDAVLQVRSLRETFTHVAAYRAYDRTLRTAHVSRAGNAVEADADLFALLRVAPEQGRTFRAGERSVTVITHAVMENMLGSAVAPLGETIFVDGIPHSVIGVLPRGFPGFERGDVFVPLEPRSGSTEVIARLANDVSASRASVQLRSLQLPDDEEYEPGSRIALNEDMAQRAPASRAGPLLVLFIAATAGVLLIGCANVATILLVRSVARMQSYAVRAALGASRRRLILENLAENVLIALAATGLGVLISVNVVNAAVYRMGASFPSWLKFPLDWHVLLFASLSAIVVLAGIGWLPAREAGRARPVSLLNTANATSSRAGSRWTRRLVAGEVAVSAALLIGTVMLLKSFNNTRNLDVGYDDTYVSVADVWLTGERFGDAAEIDQYFTDVDPVLDRLLPGRWAYYGNLIRFRSSATDTIADSNLSPELAGQMETRADEFGVVSDRFFDVLGLRITAGRSFGSQDQSGSALSAVVSASLARALWPDADAVGRSIRMKTNPDVTATVIGIASDRRSISSSIRRGVEARATREIYFSQRQATARRGSFYSSNPGGPAAVQPLAAALQAASPDVAAFRVETLRARNTQHAEAVSVLGSLFGVVAFIALVLSAMGLFGIMAYTTRQRTREIGIRVVLGASAGHILRDILGGAVALVARGLLVGVVLAFLLGKGMTVLLYGVSVLHAPSYLLVGIVFLLIAAIAAWGPARHAIMLEPATALRPDA